MSWERNSEKNHENLARSVGLYWNYIGLLDWTGLELARNRGSCRGISLKRD